jgi:NADH:ubiquinone oxidoreductase subunit 5 (subunit L)/multisubunit Na+/H+ antiporter MnhA subunit
MALGMAGALLGISLALYQRDLKRVLAYSSIENIGVALLGIGVGYWGMSRGDARIAALGMCGGLLHLWNHGLMKGLMFFGAGSVLHGTGTKDLERLGGLMHAMPRTGAAMMVGAVAIAALPPLNGFLGEWLIYLGLIGGGVVPHGVAMLFMVAGLALVGGLAALCFVRLAGVTLLGTPRSQGAEHAEESSLWMVGPIWMLVLSCIAVALFPTPVLALMSRTIAQLLGPGIPIDEVVGTGLATLGTFNAALWALLGALGVVLVVRRQGRAAADATWGCGYAAPTARMQYTAGSFSELLAERLLPTALRARVRRTAPQGIFPTAGRYSTECIDPLTRGVYEPLFDRWGTRFFRLRWLQQGLLHVYVVYILTTVVLGLTWTAYLSWSRQ